MDLIRKTYHTTKVQITAFQSQKGITEYHVLFQQTDSLEDFKTQLQHIQEAYNQCIATLSGNPTAVFRRYFLSDVTNQTNEVMELERLSSYCALSIVQQAPMNGTKVALWVWLQTGVQTQVLPSGLFEARHNGYCQLLGANQCNRAANSEFQTRLIFRDYIMQLTEAGCTLAANCLRTWIFVQNVDVNYPGVVKARKEIFATQNLTEDTHYISSTGIEGRYVDPMVFVTMDTYAISGIQPEQIQYLYAPKFLNRTYEYGVTFERGTAVTFGDRRHIYISGTASIDRFGEIVHAGDVIKQTKRMIENICALLDEAEATLEDVMQAIIYIRDTADYARVKQYMETNHPNLPYLIVRAPVCRTGWLVEMECTAVTNKGDNKFVAF
ncbi:MAG: hypothetical protein E7085_05305 [Parabacteroides distasonis]|nr:hypothetical protein [Parabacteroides distasonis]MBQ4162523.1 hypothetical protein [Parabacteroides sp.]MBR2497030.1 hypothetical protein [Parabacteroides sp.]